MSKPILDVTAHCRLINKDLNQLSKSTWGLINEKHLYS